MCYDKQWSQWGETSPEQRLCPATRTGFCTRCINASHSLDSFHGFSSPGSKHRVLFPELTMYASEPGMEVYTCDPSTWEVEKRGWGIQGHPYHDSQNDNMTIGKKWIQVSSFFFLGSFICSECVPQPPAVGESTLTLWFFHHSSDSSTA